MNDAPTYDPLAGLMTVPAAAIALKLSENSIYRMIVDGRLAAIRHGGKSWIEPEEIDDYLARQRVEAARRREIRAKTAKTSRSGGADRPRVVKALAG
jgi:excisionase family DNA binding protein